MHMFRKESDYEAFERVMVEAHLRQLGRWNGRRTGRLESRITTMVIGRQPGIDGDNASSELRSHDRGWRTFVPCEPRTDGRGQ